MGCFTDQAILALHRHELKLALRNCEVIDRLLNSFSRPSYVHLLVTTSLRSGIHLVIREGILLQTWDLEALESLSILSPTGGYRGAVNMYSNGISRIFEWTNRNRVIQLGKILT